MGPVTAHLELGTLLGREMAYGNFGVEWAKLPDLGYCCGDGCVRVYLAIEANCNAILPWICWQDSLHL